MNTTDDPMITYRIGRFIVQVPLSMNKMIQTGSLRHRELRDVVWPADLDEAQARKDAWEKRMKEITQLQAPKGKLNALIEQREFHEAGNNSRVVLYYGDTNDDERIFSEVLVSTRTHGLWIKSRAVQDKVERMLAQNVDIARAYRPLAPDAPLPKENAFYLDYGAIALPYISQERTYSRFEGHPLNLKLEIETNEIHKDEPEGEGLLGRLAAVLSTGFAAGVDIEKIRTGKRTVGGLNGEETVLRADDKKKVSLSFMWRYAGKKDSGDYPEIVIEIDTRDGQLDEKLKLWDAILNSFKPAGR